MSGERFTVYDNYKPGQKLVYVSGPYRDKRGAAFVEENIRRAEDVAKMLWKQGHAVICPHANTRHFDGVVSCDAFIAGDLTMVERCDVIVMLPGWHRSEGSKLELERAREAECQILYWVPGIGGVSEAKLAKLMAIAVNEVPPEMAVTIIEVAEHLAA